MDIQKHPVWQKVSPFKKPAHLARFFLVKRMARMYPRSRFIGITGSVGKTTTKELCYSVLSQKFNVLASRKNIDPVFNIPETIMRMRPKTEKVILEMGVEYPGDMEFYLSLVQPNTAIVTRVFFAHSQFLGDVENIAEEKSLLVKNLPKNGTAILNWDDVYVRKMADQTAASVVFYGSDKKECDVWASNISIENYQTVFLLNHSVERIEIKLQLLGKHFVYPALAAAALGLSVGLNLMNIKRGLEAVGAPEHRLQLLEGTGPWIVLDDTYNSSPIAVEEAINLMKDLPARRRIVVLGEMRELGIYSEKLHRHIAQKLYSERVDLVMLGGGDARFIGDELIRLGMPPEKVLVNQSNQQIVSSILKIAGKGDIILVKGSHAIRMDEIVGRISKKHD